jgi:hypothetical protein
MHVDIVHFRLRFSNDPTASRMAHSARGGVLRRWIAVVRRTPTTYRTLSRRRARELSPSALANGAIISSSVDC